MTIRHNPRLSSYTPYTYIPCTRLGGNQTLADLYTIPYIPACNCLVIAHPKVLCISSVYSV